MAQTPKHQIVDTIAHAKGIDALPIKKQDALILAFGLKLHGTNMNREERLGFVDARLAELNVEGALHKLARDNNEQYEKIAAALGHAAPDDEHWTERLQRENAVEGKIASLGL